MTRKKMTTYCNYNMNSIIDQWNEAAKTYSEKQEASAFALSNRKIVEKRFPKLNGEKVLDLGCGYGCYTDYFRSIGGDVVGVDGAGAMIGIAKERYPDCSFLVADITRPLPFESDSFDIVFCNQVLMDIEEVKNVFEECKRVLKPKGTLYYSIVHPAFYNGEWKDGGKLITSYITPEIKANDFWGETKHFHRSLSFYLNAASDVGMMLVHAEEPRAYEEEGKNGDIPLFFFAEYIL